MKTVIIDVQLIPVGVFTAEQLWVKQTVKVLDQNHTEIYLLYCSSQEILIPIDAVTFWSLFII